MAGLDMHCRSLLLIKFHYLSLSHASRPSLSVAEIPLALDGDERRRQGDALWRERADTELESPRRHDFGPPPPQSSPPE